MTKIYSDIFAAFGIAWYCTNVTTHISDPITKVVIAIRILNISRKAVWL